MIYEGQFFNDKYSGNGKLYSYNNQPYYQGQFKNGLKHGHGILYNYSKKKDYEGEFFKGFKFGQGIQYDEKGEKQIFEGYFAYDSPDPEEQFLRAAKYSDFKMLKDFIENKKLPADFEKHRPGTWGAFSRESPIHGALQCCNIEMVEYLLKNGAKLQAKFQSYNWKGSGSTETAFQLGLKQSINKNNLNLLKLLFKYGGDPNLQQVHEGHTMRTDQITKTFPLIDAINRNSYNFVKCLLKAKANPNCLYRQSGSCEYGQEWDAKLSALHLAAKRNNFKIVKILIKYGADVNNSGNEIENVEDNTIDVPEDNDPRDENFICTIINKYFESTPLNLAIQKNQVDNAIILLLNGANLEINQVQDKKIQITNFDLCKSEEMKKALKFEFSKEQLKNLISSKIKKEIIYFRQCMKKVNASYRSEIFQGKILKYFFLLKQ